MNVRTRIAALEASARTLPDPPASGSCRSDPEFRRLAALFVGRLADALELAGFRGRYPDLLGGIRADPCDRRNRIDLALEDAGCARLFDAMGRRRRELKPGGEP